MRIAYTNLVDAATLTASSEDTRYPVENVQNQRLGKVWRTLQATSLTCVVDLGAAADVDTIAIIGHTMTATATLNIEANSSDSWGAPAFTTGLTAISGDMVLKYLTSAESYRYWRFTIDDASAGSYIDIGRLWLGTYLQLDLSSTTGFTVSKKRSDNVTYGRGRQHFATQGVGWREFSLNFRNYYGTALTSIQTMFDTVGKFDSVIFSNFDTDRSYDIVEPCYVSIQDDLDFGHKRSMHFDFSLRLAEDK